MTKQRVLDDDIVSQHSEKVVKPDDEMHNDQRFDALESQINQLKSLLLLNEGDILHKIKKEGEPNGLGRIRTGDLRRVKAEALGVFEAFSVGDSTVRKANDPSHKV